MYRMLKLMKLSKKCSRKLSTTVRPVVVLGIETSCDDTGVAIVDSTGKVLGDALKSQQVIHLRNGGILPPVARQLHEDNIFDTYKLALKASNLEMKDIDAIATTIKPGLEYSLIVGKDFGKYLAKSENKPFIPIHHMEAHALMARMVEKVEFPYLVLLISGGHCLLALVKSVDEFYLLGQSRDDAPGEALDKASRCMKLSNLPEYAYMCGGQAIELAAKKADNPDEFLFNGPLLQHRDCSFSFSGIKSTLFNHVNRQEEIHKIKGIEVLPSVNNLSAGFLMACTRHLCQRTLRAMEYISRNELLPKENRNLVISGGVASNDFIARALEIVCAEMDFKLVRTPKKLCSDNGIMIAWNGIERYVTGKGVITDVQEISKVDVQGRSPLGEDWTQKVADASIKAPKVKLKFKDLINEPECEKNIEEILQL